MDGPGPITNIFGFKFLTASLMITDRICSPRETSIERNQGLERTICQFKTQVWPSRRIHGNDHALS